MNRRVEPEILDTLPPGDPRALRSRQDLRRVNWWMGNHSIMAAALRQNANGGPPGPILELGAGDGHFLLTVARKLSPAWAPAEATLLDRQLLVSNETRSAFAALNWKLSVATGDALDWELSAAPAPAVVLANLFLHHFTEAELAQLFRKIAPAARLFVAVEPRRMAWPGLGRTLLTLVRCNDVTRHDAAVSIRAGFAGREISALWPDHQRWQVTERPSGVFSHLFIARKLG